MTRREGVTVYYLQLQYSVLGPLCSALALVVRYEVKDISTKKTLVQLFTFLGLLSMAVCIYATIIIVQLAESCEYVPALAAQRNEFSIMDKEEDDVEARPQQMSRRQNLCCPTPEGVGSIPTAESQRDGQQVSVSTVAGQAPGVATQGPEIKMYNFGRDLPGINLNVDAEGHVHKKTYTPKNAWIVIVTALPAVAGLIIGIVVDAHNCQEGSGYYLSELEWEGFLSGFAACCFQFLGMIFAVTKAFPVRQHEAIIASNEIIANRKIEAEVVPLEVLKDMINVFQAQYDKRSVAEVGVTSKTEEGAAAVHSSE